jgi:uncharacterized protein (TIGR03437 family)
MLLASVGVAMAQQPTVNQNGMVNSSNGSHDNPPGSLILIFGTNMGPASLLKASSTPLSTQIQGGSDTVAVSISNGGVTKAAPIFYVSANQSSVQLPWEIPTGTANIVVTRNGNASSPQSFHVATFSPGIFTVSQNGVGMGEVFNAVPITVNGKLTLAIAQPPGSVPGLTAIPAKAGDHLLAYVTGLGPVQPTVADGAAPCPLSGCPPGVVLSKTTTLPQVMVGGVQAKIEFSGLAPQYVGVYQVNFRMPEGVTPGNAVPLQISIGGVTSTNQVAIAVQ